MSKIIFTILMLTIVIIMVALFLIVPLFFITMAIGFDILSKEEDTNGIVDKKDDKEISKIDPTSEYEKPKVKEDVMYVDKIFLVLLRKPNLNDEELKILKKIGSTIPLHYFSCEQLCLYMDKIKPPTQSDLQRKKENDAYWDSWNLLNGP